MSSYFHAVAVDFDGTLTEGRRPVDAILDAIADHRRAGIRVVLVTGRILSELRHVFPDVDEHFDSIVAENGALISGPHGRRLLVDPVDKLLEDALLRRRVPVRSGDVLLACDASHDRVVLEEIGRLGLDCQILRNRAALMVLPAGVTKASGLLEALAELGVSFHSTIAVGDAENDRSLLDACEYGVAVANAVDTLKQHADLVLDAPDGTGVLAILQSPILTDNRRTQSSRWRLQLGVTGDGQPVTIPASQINVLITGGSGMGKSYLAGLLAESVSELDYAALIVDLEGDHLGLDDLRGVLSVGGTEPLPDPGEVHRLIRHRFGSVVLDLALLAPCEQDAYIASLPTVIEEERELTGLPHWVLVDEAHRLVGTDLMGATMLHAPNRGHCLVTYQPEHLTEISPEHLDVILLTPGLDDSQLTWLAEAAKRDLGQITDLLAGVTVGEAVIIEPATPEHDRRFTVGRRRTSHVRHWHKYARRPLDPHLHFHFRTAGGVPTGNVATSLYEFHHLLRQSPPDVIEHHAARHDFSTWIHMATSDNTLRDSLAATERTLPHVEITAIRQSLVRDIEQRYIEPGPPEPVLTHLAAALAR